MRHIAIIAVFLALFFAPIYALCLDENDRERDDIVGFWLTPKDKESGRESIAEIVKENGKYFGYHAAFLDALPSEKDTKNEHFSLRDRDILGSVYIYDLQRNAEDSYIKGRFYDFNIGRTFHLRIAFKCDTMTLNVSVDNAGMLGRKITYRYISPKDAAFYIHDKPPLNYGEISTKE